MLSDNLLRKVSAPYVDLAPGCGRPGGDGGQDRRRGPRGLCACPGAVGWGQRAGGRVAGRFRPAGTRAASEAYGYLNGELASGRGA